MSNTKTEYMMEFPGSEHGAMFVPICWTLWTVWERSRSKPTGLELLNSESNVHHAALSKAPGGLTTVGAAS